MKRLDCAWFCWTLALVPPLAFDWWLVRSGRRSLSRWAGLHPVVATVGCAALAVHFQSGRLRRTP